MVTDITSTFLDVVQAIFEGIGTGLVSLFNTIILEEVSRDPGVDTILYTADDVVTYGGLSNLGIWMVAFMGVSFALTIFYALFRKVA